MESRRSIEESKIRAGNLVAEWGKVICSWFARLQWHVSRLQSGSMIQTIRNVSDKG
jgi:hypothetical protein